MMGDYNFLEKCWNKENIETMLENEFFIVE
jgi:hypothetical protein